MPGVHENHLTVDNENDWWNCYPPMRAKDTRLLHLLGNNVERSRWNLARTATGERQAIIEGDIAPLGSAYATFDSNLTWLTTGENELAEQTTFLVLQTQATGADNANRAAFFGNFGGGNGGSMFFQPAVGQLRFQGYDLVGTNKTRVLTGLDLSAWNLFAGVLSNSLIGLYRLTGLTATSGLTGADRITELAISGRKLGTGKERIGAVYGTYGGASRMALVQKMAGAFTPTELIAMTADFIRPRMAERGITI